MTAEQPQPSRVRFSREELEHLSKDDLIKNWLLQDQYLETLETRSSDSNENMELINMKESEENLKLKHQQLEATRRENILVMRLTAKEQEMQEYASQIQELKQAQIPSVAQLRSALLDPAVNLMFERMRKELDSTKARLEETQNELSAWKFTPDSNTGKRLMAKCRLLHQENEELGKMTSSGRMAKLEGDLALQRKFNEEMKKSQSELDEFLLELDEDVEGMQSTIYYLQQQLREAKDQIHRLQQENQKLSILLTNSPANHRLQTEESTATTDTEERPTSPEDIPVKEGYQQPVVICCQENSSDQNLNVSNRGGTWSLQQYEHSRTDTRTVDQKVPVDKGGDLSNLVEEGYEDSQSSVEPLQIQVETHVEDIVCEEDLSTSSLGEVQNAAISQIGLQIEIDESTQESLNERVSLQIDSGLPFELSNTEKQNIPIMSSVNKHRSPSPQENHNSGLKWPSENGQNKKRTRHMSPEENTTEEDTDISLNTKRIKQDITIEEKIVEPEQRTPLEIDTDTEVQVAQTLAWWAAANKERKESQLIVQDTSTDSVGNGEIESSCASEDGNA